MANRTTIKSNIQTKNIPSVTNAILTDILNVEMCDNIVFKEDVAVTQVTSTSAVSIDFANKDAVYLDATGVSGSSIAITCNSIVNGQMLFLKVSKSSGKSISFVGFLDITSNTDYVTLATELFYRLIRKGTTYIAEALIKTVNPATENLAGIVEFASQAEHNELYVENKVCTPGLLPKSTENQTGLIHIATDDELNAGGDYNIDGDTLGVRASQLRARTKDTRKSYWKSESHVVEQYSIADFSFTFAGMSGKTFIPMYSIQSYNAGLSVDSWIYTVYDSGTDIVVTVRVQNHSIIETGATINCGLILEGLDSF